MVKSAPHLHRKARGKASHQKGLWAERLCVFLLRCKGYQILVQRYKTPVGEIDIIAKKRGVIAFIEVKARPDLHQAHEAISPHQQSRLTCAAHHFLARHPQKAHDILRFDVMFIVPKRWPRHILNAFSGDALTAR